MGPSASSRLSEKSRANTSTVNTRAWRVRRVESASWCGSWPWAVRMMKLSTPASSQDPSRSFIQRCSVLRRTEALPGKGRLVAVLTPYSIVGARRVSSAPGRAPAPRVGGPRGGGPRLPHGGCPAGAGRAAGAGDRMLRAGGARGRAAAGFLRPEGDAGRRRRRGAAAGGARHDGRALAPPGRVRARAGRRAVRLANAGRGAWRRDPRPQRRGRRLGGPPPIRSRAGHRGAARRHHTILRVARGPAPDAGRRERGGDRAARCGPGGAGSGSRGERAVRGRLRGGAAVLYARSRAARTGRVRLLPDLLRARRHPVQRPAGAAVAGRREARRAARRDAARGRGARGGPRAARPGRAGGALALARRARGGLVRGARAAGLVVAHGGAVLARRLLPSRAGRVQRVGRLAHRGWGGGAVRRERAVAARARAALVDRRRRGRAGAPGAVPPPLPRPRHRAAGGRAGGRTGPPRRVAARAPGNRAARAAASYPRRAVRLVARLAACH